MGCDIHLHLERRKIANSQDNLKHEWRRCQIIGYGGEWSDRIYGMFALLANVRNYSDYEPIEQRGFPTDADYRTKLLYSVRVIPNEEYEKYTFYEDGRYCRKSQADKWIRQGCSEPIEIVTGQSYVTHPDWHSPNWCTAQEMEQCVTQLFFRDGEWIGDYFEWKILSDVMKLYEESGEYECRAVFWFDN